MNSKDQGRGYVLKFADDEFDRDRFDISGASFNISQVGVIPPQAHGHVTFYEFEIENDKMRYQGGGVVNGNLFITLNERPGLGPPGGQGASVFIRGAGDKAWIPVGRALLTLR